MTLPPLFLGAPTGMDAPAAQVARRDADAEPRSTLPELPEDIREQILGYAVNYSEEFERAPNLSEERVGVPYPQGDALHGKHKEDFKILEIGACAVWPDACREYLITALLTNEKAYWDNKGRNDPYGTFNNVLAAVRARQGAGATLFDAVLDAIHRRDGVQVVTLPANNELNLQERVALQRIDRDEPLSWSNATANVLRARYWFEEYAKRHVDGVVTLGRRSQTSHKPVSAHDVELPYEERDGLRAATRIVALAQALVRLRDAGREDLAEFLTLAITYPTYNPGGMRNALTFWNTPVTFYYHTGKTAGPSTIDEFINEAKEVIRQYGPPDAWNTSGIRSLALAFAAFSLVDTNSHDTELMTWQIQNRWRGTFQQPSIRPPTIGKYKELAEAVEGVLGTRAIQLQWPVGLYDTSDATDLSSCFAGCDTFSEYLHGWNTANVVNTKRCFLYCKTFNRPLQSWNVGACVEFDWMFNKCVAFNQPLDAWVVRQAPAVNMWGMFADCVAFTQPLDSWYDQLQNRGTVLRMFDGASAWLALARRQQADGSQFFSRLAPHVNCDTGDLVLTEGAVAVVAGA